MPTNNEEILKILGRFAFHLSDTHGIPKEIFVEKYTKNGAWDLVRVFNFIFEHNDFMRQERRNAKSIA